VDNDDDEDGDGHGPCLVNKFGLANRRHDDDDDDDNDDDEYDMSLLSHARRLAVIIRTRRPVWTCPTDSAPVETKRRDSIRDAIFVVVLAVIDDDDDDAAAAAAATIITVWT
jgi:hypothetical protein